MHTSHHIEPLQLDAVGPHPVLMPLYKRNYELIRDGIKTHEFRKRYPTVPTIWYVMVAQPVWQVVARIKLGTPHHASVDQLVQSFDGVGCSRAAGIRSYFRDYSHGYAVPIEQVEECKPLSRSALPDLSRVPNDFLPLSLNADLLGFLEEWFDSQSTGRLGPERPRSASSTRARGSDDYG